MSRDSVYSRWWYATVALVVLVAVYVTQTPPDASIFSFGLNIILVLSMLFFLAMDIRAIRRSESSWNPSRVYALSGLFTPLLILYGYRRYQHVGLI